jgi:hypothetical protein
VAQPPSLAHFGQPTCAPSPSLSSPSAHRANPPARARVQPSSPAAQPQLSAARAQCSPPRSQRRAPPPSPAAAQRAWWLAGPAPCAQPRCAHATTLAWSACCCRRPVGPARQDAETLCFFPKPTLRTFSRPRRLQNQTVRALAQIFRPRRLPSSRPRSPTRRTAAGATSRPERRR